MSSKAPKFKSIKFTGMKTNRKLFNVEVSNTKKTHNYKPRFYTNRNLFYVKCCRKYYSNKNKNKLQLNFIKNQRKLLAKRELRKKHCFFITHQYKQTNNSLVKKEGQSPKPSIKFKNKLKFKVSTSKEKPKIKIENEDDNKNNISIQKANQINNNSTKIISQFRQISKIQNNNGNNNLTISEEDNFFTLSNNTSIKPNQEKSKFGIGRWHLSEHKKFIDAIIKYGNDWKKVQNHIGTRSSSQARSHAQKFFIKLKEEQKKMKISKEIDYSNSTVKSFYDALQSMNQEKRENIIKELENVVFDNQLRNKSKKRSKSKNNCYSESGTDGFISCTEFLDEYTVLLDDKKNIERMSIDSLGEKEEKKDKRKFKEEKNDMFTDEEYEKSFHKVFIEKEFDKIEPESRKQSIEDDFMFNINI